MSASNIFALLLLIAAVAAYAPSDLAANDPHAPWPMLKPERVQPAANFSIEDYTGLWYEFARANTPFELGLKCVTAQYTLQDDGSVRLINRGVRQYPSLKRISEIGGVALVANSDEPAKLTIKFDGLPVTAQYWVLNTDYTSWAVVYSPKNSRLALPSVYILTRQPIPSRRTVKAALNELAMKTGMLISDLHITEQQQTPC